MKRLNRHARRAALSQRFIPRPCAKAGYSAIELSFSVSIFVVVLLSSLAMVDRDTHLSRSSLSIGTVETLAQEMLFELEREIINAAGETPLATLDAPFGPGESATLSVDSTVNFPPNSGLILDWNKENTEVIAYQTFSNDQENFLQLERGQECTQASGHDFQASALWSGLGLVAAQQVPAPAGFGRQASELTGPMWFAGQGTGFVYRVPVDPVDPMNGTAFLDGDDIMWGAPLDAAIDPRDCYVSVYFQPRTTLSEAQARDDINNDGDQLDVFDVGQIRRIVWDSTDPGAAPQDIGLGPTAVLQEQCNYGSDLNGDGFADPLFLWDPRTRQLHVRIMVVGASVADLPIVRMVESIIYLRNSPPSSV